LKNIVCIYRAVYAVHVVVLRNVAHLPTTQIQTRGMLQKTPLVDNSTHQTIVIGRNLDGPTWLLHLVCLCLLLLLLLCLVVRLRRKHRQILNVVLVLLRSVVVNVCALGQWDYARLDQA